jgi:hypothetical protein
MGKTTLTRQAATDTAVIERFGKSALVRRAGDDDGP